MNQPKKIFIIAGEESGDNLGSKLIKAIKQKQPDTNFIGVGGMKMAYEGLHTIFPMQEINLMGFLEILPHAAKLIKRINETVDRIIAEKPDVLITIDSPGFNFRVVKKLKEKNINIKKIHYVAPSVWAYKPERAKKTAQLFDRLICILPWEPPYFEAEGLKTTFVGHPIFEDMEFLDHTEQRSIREKYNYTDSDKVIAILPGSRRGEVKRLLPIFIEAAQKISQANPHAKFVLMPTENLRNEISQLAHTIPNCTIVSDTTEKRRLLQACNAAIVKSGTVALEVAATQCPHIICYKVNALTHWLIRRMLNIAMANLVNISANKQIIRELIQNDCTAENISRDILLLINSETAAKGQLAEARTELVKMGLDQQPKPSINAAEVVLEAI